MLGAQCASVMPCNGGGIGSEKTQLELEQLNGKGHADWAGGKGVGWMAICVWVLGAEPNEHVVPRELRLLE